MNTIRPRALLAGQTEFRAAAAGPASAEITLYDEVGGYGVTAATFRDALARVSGAKELKLRINSPGGDVFDGLAIHNMLARFQGKITVTVDGLAASIASLIAMAGDVVVMPSNAMMLVHNPHGGVLGDAADMTDMAALLDKIKGQMVATYAMKTGQTVEKLAALLDAETWLSASEAKDLGFADEKCARPRVLRRNSTSLASRRSQRCGRAWMRLSITFTLAGGNSGTLRARGPRPRQPRP
jgi:ATP-dependent Clp endopeptidase proteolytic subunit ClpP